MKRLILVFCAAFVSIGLAAQAYDDGLVRSTPEAEGIRSEAIADWFRALEEGGYEVHGLMLLRHDKVVAEHWWAPYGPQYPHAMYSATKTFTGAAVGFAVQEGLLKVSDKVASFFPDLMPEKTAPELERLTVEHLLTMSAGHARTQYPGSGDDQVRSFLAMDYAHEPGTSFAYNITCSHMLSQIITRVTGLTLYEYLKPRLLDPLGIRDVVWEMDLDGRNMGNGGMHSKTSDLAKMGIFLKNKGVWQGKQLLNREWVEAMTTPHIYQRPELSEEENNKDDAGQGYGYQVWMGRHNSWRAIGGQNQLIMVIPEYDVVVASNGQIGDEAGFNQLIYNLLDGMSDKRLKPTKGFDLQAAIGGYELKHPFPEPSAAPSERSRTLRYLMDRNAYGLTGIAFRFDAQGNMTLTLESGEAIHNIPFGLDSWAMGSTDRKLLFGGTVYANTMNTTPMTTAGWCSWTGADELGAYYLSLFNNGCQERFRFNFSPDRNDLTITVVAPQPRRFQGNPAPAPATRDITLTASRIQSTIPAEAQPFPQPDLMIDLWPNGAPTDNGLTGPENDYGNHVSNVTKPTLGIYLPKKPNGLAILVCPGGGYVDVWDKTEGYFNSKWYTDQGIVYAVLKYRLPNGHPEVPQDDVHEAMRFLWAHADEYGFRKLGIAGCSAGGHLAATVATHFSEPSERPDFQILFYPVISMDPAITHAGSSFFLLGQNPSQTLLDEYSNEKQVTSDTPPAFIMANSDDGAVPCENSLRYYEALRAHGVSAALHIYPVGGHGWADHTDFPYRDAWMHDLQIWLSGLAE